MILKTPKLVLCIMLGLGSISAMSQSSPIVKRYAHVIQGDTGKPYRMIVNPNGMVYFEYDPVKKPHMDSVLNSNMPWWEKYYWLNASDTIIRNGPFEFIVEDSSYLLRLPSNDTAFVQYKMSTKESTQPFSWPPLELSGDNYRNTKTHWVGFEHNSEDSILIFRREYADKEIRSICRIKIHRNTGHLVYEDCFSYYPLTSDVRCGYYEEVLLD